MMVYLDYASSTPIDEEVLKTYSRALLEYYNKMSVHNDLGIRSRHLYSTSLTEMARCLGIKKEEIILNNDNNYEVLLDIINSNRKRKNRIIISKLEVPYMYEFVKVLEDNGFKIDYVNNDEEGLIDLKDLKELITSETLLVSVPYVNGELGIREPIKSIKQTIKKIDEGILLFSDLTYAFGRININFNDIDIGMMCSDNIFGIKGKGIVFKKDVLDITNEYKVDLPSVVALSKMIEINIESLNDRENKVLELKKKIKDKLGSYENLLFNSNKYSIPYIINISLMDRYTTDIIDSMNDCEIYLSNMDESSDFSTSVMAVYGNKVRSLTSIRISLAHLVSHKDIDYFLEVFDNIYSEGVVNNEKDNSVD